MNSALIGIIGVIVGAFLTVILTATKEWFFHRLTKKKEQTYLAIQISCLLEQFISGCVDVAYDDGLFHGQRDEQGCLSVQVSPPIFEPLKADVNWKCLPTDLMYNILKLPSQIHEANAYISAVSEYSAHPPNYEALFNAREERYSELGLIALDLMDELSELASLPLVIDKTEWSPKSRLKSAYEHAVSKIAERDRCNQEIIKSISANT